MEGLLKNHCVALSDTVGKCNKGAVIEFFL